MDLQHLLTSFDGRIGRQRFWLGMLILIIAGLVLSLIVVWPLSAAGPRLAALGNLIVSLALLYPAMAVGIKRFHDRGKSGTLMAIVVAPGLVSGLGDALGLTTTERMVAGEAVLLPNTFGWLLLVVTLGVAIWALIELGIRKGTDGPNAYGADPLAATAT